MPGPVVIFIHSSMSLLAQTLNPFPKRSTLAEKQKEKGRSGKRRPRRRDQPPFTPAADIAITPC